MYKLRNKLRSDEDGAISTLHYELQQIRKGVITAVMQ
jgi:hypothetical protein